MVCAGGAALALKFGHNDPVPMSTLGAVTQKTYQTQVTELIDKPRPLPASQNKEGTTNMTKLRAYAPFYI